MEQRVLLEKLIVTHSASQILHLLRNRMFITVLGRARHGSLSRSTRVQVHIFSPYYSIYVRTILILFSHL